MTVFGAYDAKTHFSALLERVAQGESIVITRHGREIARLVPPQDTPAPQRSAAELAAQWRKGRGGVRLGSLKLRDLINEGRR